MSRILSTSLLALAVLAGPAFAETVEVKMLNKGGNGDVMAFEPDFVRIQPGDTVRFLVTDKGHNAESVDGMIPEDGTAFEGKMNAEVEFSPEVDGVYAVKCKPHWSFGMVMIVAVGDVTEAPADFFEGRIPPKAKARFEAQLEKLAEPAS